MKEVKFHKKNGSFKLHLLAEISESKLLDESFSEIMIDNIAPLSTAKEGEITFLQNPKYIEDLKLTNASAVIVAEKHVDKVPENVAILLSNNPYYSYSAVARKFYEQSNHSLEISEFSNVSLSADIGKRTVIKDGAYVGPNCVIGNDCIIHPNASISNAIIGDNVIIHSGVSIGQDGFGYAFYKGKHHKVPQIGRVIIESDVEIGANTCIDRGAGPDTIIGEGTKIDNLVQIGHNVKIGKHCIIVSHVGISGSTTIGNYTIIGGQVGVAGHLKIGSQVQIAAQSGVMHNIPDKEVYGGSPAVPIRQYHKQTLAVSKLVEAKKNS